MGRERIYNTRGILQTIIIVIAMLTFGCYLFVSLEKLFFLVASCIITVVVSQFIKVCIVENSVIEFFYPMRLVKRRYTVNPSSVKKVVYSESMEGKNNPYIRFYLSDTILPIEIKPDSKVQFHKVIDIITEKPNIEVIKK